jgi:hypothetical protein
MTSPSPITLSPSIACRLNPAPAAELPARTAASCPIFIRRPVSWRKAAGIVTVTLSALSRRCNSSVTSLPASALSRRL